MDQKKSAYLNTLYGVREIPPVNSSPVNCPQSRFRLGVGQLTGRQFDWGKLTGGELTRGGIFLVPFVH